RSQDFRCPPPLRTALLEAAEDISVKTKGRAGVVQIPETMLVAKLIRDILDGSIVRWAAGKAPVGDREEVVRLAQDRWKDAFAVVGGDGESTEDGGLWGGY
ncbi:MAG: hypothetical protein LQ341_007662, partial [Variospora aurantia]